MNELEWMWDVKYRFNLYEAPSDNWREAYHWLEDQWRGQVVLTVNEDLEVVAYLCEVMDA